MEIICLLFTIVGLVIFGRWIYRQNWQFLYKVGAIGVCAVVGLGLLNALMTGSWTTEFTIVTGILGSCGVVAVANWVIRRWAANHVVVIVTVILSIILVGFMMYRVVKNGIQYSSRQGQTVSAPSNNGTVANQPVPVPAPVPRQSKSKVKKSDDVDPCKEYSYQLKKDLGCPE